ncbi:MAG: hypothetical protein GF418_09680 [Chitinivibrionales bacterium]|nr:hypothetical protein [Chitinivibrionales bacterium]MBD3395880.1 hypothetical protein [Chitinivibrionales bacterium]
MKVKVEGREFNAKVAEYRCRDFVTATFFIDGTPVPLADTVGGQYRLVEATPREREILKCWGYRLDGL